MIKSIFMVLLCVHLLGDFYFQTQKMADNKQGQFSWTVCHCLIYGAGAEILFFLFLPGMDVKYILAFVLAHALIDIIKYAACRLGRAKQKAIDSPRGRRNVFLIDQAAHLLVILGIAYWMRQVDITSLYREEAGILFDAFDIPELTFLKWAAVLLVIHKPVNILIANILSWYKPSDENVSNQENVSNKEKDASLNGESAESDSAGTDRNAGRMIGTLERIIMVIFIAIGQYSAVGLVLTAKSIARYDRISKDQVFAEYYLLGTLLSTICAVVAALLFL